MNLAEALLQLYPDAEPMRDYMLQDTGAGVYIAVWNLSEPRPTRQQLANLGVREGTTMSVVREWADLNRKLIAQAGDVIDATARPRRLGQANNIPAIIDATTPGDEVADSGWTRERATAVNAMWESFDAWLQTPLDGVDLAPIQVLSMPDDT